MAADVRDLLIKMSLDISGYKQNIAAAKNDLKLLKAEFKNAEADTNLEDAGDKLKKNLEEQLKTLKQMAEGYKSSIQAAASALEAGTGTTREAQLKKQLTELETQAATTETQIKKVQEAIDNIKTEMLMNKVGTMVDGLAQLSNGIDKLFGDAAREAADTGYNTFVSREDAYAGVTKALGKYNPTRQQIDELRDGLEEMTTRIPKTYEELAAIMAMAAQAGGVPLNNLLKFTETFAALGVSTDLIGEGGVKTFAQFLNLSDGVSDKAKEAGSALVALGNTQAATENDIIMMAQRMASATNLAGFGTEDILAYSAAFSALGIRAEAGGSAFSKLVDAMAQAVDSGGDDLDTFARLAGQTADEFTAAWNKNPADAMAGFFRSMGEMGESGEESLFAMLDEMGITEVRQSNLIRATANGWELLAEALGIAREGYAENIALDEEAAGRYGTTASQNQMNANKWANAAAALGEGVKAIRQPFDDFFADVAQGFAEMPDWVHGAAAGVAEAGKTLSGILGTAGDVGLGIYGVTKGIQTLKGMKIPAILTGIGKGAAVGAGVLGFAGLTKIFLDMQTSTDAIVKNLGSIRINVDEGSKNAALQAIKEVQEASERLNGISPEEEERLQKTSRLTQMGYGSDAMYGKSLAYETSQVQQTLDDITLKYGSMIADLDDQILAAEDEATRQALAKQRTQTEQQMQTAIDNAKDQYSRTLGNLIGGMMSQASEPAKDALSDVSWSVAAYKEMMAQYETETDPIRKRALEVNMKNELTTMQESLETVLQDADFGSIISAALESGAFDNADLSMLGDWPTSLLEAYNFSAAIQEGGNAVEIGRNLVEGLSNGMQENANLVGPGVTALRDETVNMLKSQFGIHSPSTLMAEQGDYIVQGLAEGIDRQQGTAVASIAALGALMQSEAARQAQLIANAMRVIVPAPQYAGGVSGGVVAGADSRGSGKNVTINNNYDLGTAGTQSTVRQLSREITGLQRRNAAALGYIG